MKLQKLEREGMKPNRVEVCGTNLYPTFAKIEARFPRSHTR